MCAGVMLYKDPKTAEQQKQMTEANKNNQVAAEDIDDQIGVQSVETGIALLLAVAALADETPPPMLKTIAARAGLPPAKAHRYMVSFTRTGMVERDAATGRYRFGPNARLIGVAAVRGSDVVRSASKRLPQLCEAARHTTALAIWTENGPTIVWVEEVRKHVTVSTRIGEVLPILDSATGRVFGAWLPRYQIQKPLANELAANRSARDGNRISRIGDAEKIFETVRQHGVGWSLGELNLGIHALAAPVFDFRGTLVGALAMLGPSASFNAAPDGPLAGLLREAAADVSATLGYSAQFG